MHGYNRAIISWAWKGEGKTEERGQHQEEKKERKSKEVLLEGVAKCCDLGPLTSNLWKGL